MIDDESRSTYLRILSEIKERLRVVEMVLEGQVQIAAKAAEESCILQFRFVSELIAIGCLILHRDLTLTKAGNLTQAWNAGQIFRKLDRLHPDFYPRPLDPQAPDKFVWEDFKGDFMTKAELVRSYDRDFGAALHRGDVRRIFRNDPALNFPKVRVTHDKFVNLPNRHTVVSSDGQHICHFNMCPHGEVPTGTLFGLLKNGAPDIAVDTAIERSN